MRWAGICALGAGMLLATESSQAAIVSWDLNIEFSGATPPAGAAPWLRASFDDGGTSGSVTMTLTPLNLVGSEFVRYWYFNLDPALAPTSLVFSAPVKAGTFTDPVLAVGVNAFQADGDGLYDIELAFANSGAERFGAGEVSYTITGIPALTASSFNFLSAPAGGNGPFHTAAHVQGAAAMETSAAGSRTRPSRAPWLY
jgi:hypothetical protein